MPENKKKLFIARNNGRYTKNFKQIFDMDAAEVIIQDHELVITPKRRKKDEVMIKANQISKILRHVPKHIPYYEFVLLDGEKFFISFYTFSGTSDRKLHRNFVKVLNENFGFSLEPNKVQITKKDKIVFQSYIYCLFGEEKGPNIIDEKEATIEVTEKYLQINHLYSNELLLKVPLTDIELFLENILVKGLNQSDQINHKIVLKNGRIFYVTFIKGTELQQELQANFGIAMNAVLSKLPAAPIIEDTELEYKFCFNCGAQMKKDAQFCEKCGTQL